MSVLNKIFKSYSEKEVKRVKPIVNKINGLEEEMTKLTDNELRAKTEFGTTDKFLRQFGIHAVDEMPNFLHYSQEIFEDSSEEIPVV